VSVDYFRGLAVVLMLIYDYVPFFTKDVPRILQHGRTDRLLFGDFVAPFFLFIMGTSLAFTMCKQRNQGMDERELFKKVLRRAFLLLLIGLAIDEARAPLLGGTLGIKWGVLETLGVSYLIAYLVMRFKSLWARGAITLAMLSLQLWLTLTIPWYRGFIEGASHGSPFSVLSWATIAIFGMIAGERLTFERGHYGWYLARFGAALIACGIIIGFIDPPRKELVSASYALVTSGGSAIVLLVLYNLLDIRKEEWMIRFGRPLHEFGVAALLAWILQYVIAAPFIWYFHTYGRISAVYGIPLSLSTILLVWIIIMEANKKGIGLKV
jgi:predicted acyltransferase